MNSEPSYQARKCLDDLAKPSGFEVPWDESDYAIIQRHLDAYHSKQSKELAEWTQTPMFESGSYWCWNGDEDAAPIHVEVFYSGTSDSYFLPAGQYGWNEAQDVEKLVGYWWMRLPEPDLPTREAIDAAMKGTKAESKNL